MFRRAAMNSSMLNAVVAQVPVMRMTRSASVPSDSQLSDEPPSASIRKLANPKFSPKSQRHTTPVTIGEISHGRKKITRAAPFPAARVLVSRTATPSAAT
jgi:hypothetical protein